MTIMAAHEPLNIHVPIAGYEICKNVDWDLSEFNPGQTPRPMVPIEQNGASFADAIKRFAGDECVTSGFLHPVPEYQSTYYDATKPTTWPDGPDGERSDTPLFLQFAQIQGSIKRAKDFANTYGLLGLDYPRKPLERLAIPKDDPNPPTIFDLDRVEPFYFWKHQSLIMYDLVNIWHKLIEAKSKDFEVLQHVLKELVTLQMDPETDKITCALKGHGFQYGVNRHIRGTTSRTAFGAVTHLLLQDINAHLRDNVTYACLFDPKTFQSYPRLKIDNLFTYLWFDFAQHITASREIRACKSCGTLFVSNPSEKRKKQSCNSTCRARVSRQNKRIRQS